MPLVSTKCSDCKNVSMLNVGTPISEQLKLMKCSKCGKNNLTRLMGDLQVYEENKHPLERIEIVGAEEIP